MRRKRSAIEILTGGRPAPRRGRSISAETVLSVVRMRALDALGLSKTSIAALTKRPRHAVRDACRMRSFQDVRRPNDADLIDAAQFLAQTIIARRRKS